LAELEIENRIQYTPSMFVCVCKAVTDGEIVQAIDSGACTREEVTRACRAGGDCGACHGAIEDMLEARADELVQLRTRAA
jgi:bacterioferritin-associated ferredoxin